MHYGHKSTRSVTLRVEAFESRCAPALIWTGSEVLDPLWDEPSATAMRFSDPVQSSSLIESTTTDETATSSSAIEGTTTAPLSAEPLSAPLHSTGGSNEIDGFTGDTPYTYGPPPGGGFGIGQAPVIVNFAGAEQSGLWHFTGTVIDDTPGGLTVRFGGAPASLQGLTAVTDASGNFSLDVNLQTNGSDTGTATSVTTDGDGLTSNVAEYFVSP